MRFPSQWRHIRTDLILDERLGNDARTDARYTSNVWIGDITHPKQGRWTPNSVIGQCT